MSVAGRCEKCRDLIVPFLWRWRHLHYPRFGRGHQAWPENVTREGSQ